MSVSTFKVDEQPNKNPKKSYFSKKKAIKMQWLLRKMCHNWVVNHKIQMHSFPQVESLGATRCRKSCIQVKKYDSLSQRFVTRVCGKNGPSLGKIQVKVPHQRIPYAVDVPEEKHGILLKTFSSSHNKTKLHSTFPRMTWVLSDASTKELEERVSD